MQLNLLHETFLVFRHDSGGVAVVNKRDDGSYGPIETPKVCVRRPGAQEVQARVAPGHRRVYRGAAEN